MLIRQRLGAILLLFTAEARDLFLGHGRVFDVQVLQQNQHIFHFISTFYQKLFYITEPLGTQLEFTDIPLEMCLQI